MITWQDYERAGENKTKWLRNAITSYRNSKEYKQAVEEEKYMAGKNTAIMDVMRVIYNMAGLPEEDFTKNNVKIRNRMIHRLVTDRCSYSLGNGVSFKSRKKTKDEEGKTVIVDSTKELLGDSFDTAVYKWGYWACANGTAWLYVHPKGDDWQYIYLFKVYMYSPSVTGYFYNCIGDIAEDDAMLYDYIEFIPLNEFKEKEIADKLITIEL